MNSIIKNIHTLNQIESFDPEIFKGRDKKEQDLCNLILTVSMIWNDIKNVMLYYEFVDTYLTKYKKEKGDKLEHNDRFQGEIYGILIHIHRMLISIIHEFFALLRNNQKTLRSSEFNAIRSKLKRKNSKALEELINFGISNRSSKTELGIALHRVRNQISNHYDPKQIFKGYNIKFFESDNLPYFSRGIKMSQQRFYFADAACQEFFVSWHKKMSTDDFFKFINDIIGAINHSISNLVIAFIDAKTSQKES